MFILYFKVNLLGTYPIWKILFLGKRKILQRSLKRSVNRIIVYVVRGKNDMHKFSCCIQNSTSYETTMKKRKKDKAV